MTPDIIYDYNFNIGDKVFVESVVDIDGRNIPYSATVIGIVGVGDNKQYIIEATPEIFEKIDLCEPNINIKTRPGYIAGMVDPDELFPAYRRLQIVVDNKKGN